MAEEQTNEVEQTEEPHGATESKTDWKAEARKWESRAKKSEAAEKELAALKEAQMTEQEKALKRAEQAESELAQLKAEQGRMQAAREISQAENVPLELLDYCADEESMRNFAAEYKKLQKGIPTVPQSFSTSRIIKDEKQKDADKRKFVRALVSAANNHKE